MAWELPCHHLGLDGVLHRRPVCAAHACGCWGNVLPGPADWLGNFLPARGMTMCVGMLAVYCNRCKLLLCFTCGLEEAAGLPARAAAGQAC